MKIRIIKSTLPTYWYADKIGQEYDADGPVFDKLLDKNVMWPSGGDGCVGVDDCEIISE